MQFNNSSTKKSDKTNVSDSLFEKLDKEKLKTLDPSFLKNLKEDLKNLR